MRAATDAAGSDWSEEEIDRIVAGYFAMLGNELGRPFNKAEHNRTLQNRIDRRRGSIEFKHQNISAVMLGLGQPWITGYKPAANFQNAPVDGVLRWLDAHPSWLTPQSRTAAQDNRVAEDASQLWIGPPPLQRNEPPPVDLAFMAAMNRKYDVAERDARNSALGRAGEELVLNHERRTRRSKLDQRLRWLMRAYGSDHSLADPQFGRVGPR